MDEIWKELPLKGYYISNLGRIKSCRAINGKGKMLSFDTGRFMKFSHDKDGYEITNIRGLSTKKVHRLVLITFEGYHPDKNKNLVNHKNEIKNDNRLCNLEWVTPMENSNYGTSKQRLSKALTGRKRTMTEKALKQKENARKNIKNVKKKAYAKKGNQFLVFDSVKQLSEHFGVKYVEISSRGKVISKGKLKGWTVNVDD